MRHYKSLLTHLSSLNMYSWRRHFGTTRIGNSCQTVSRSLSALLYTRSSSPGMDAGKWIHYQGNDCRASLCKAHVGGKDSNFHVWTTSHGQVCVFAQFRGIGLYGSRLVRLL